MNTPIDHERELIEKLLTGDRRALARLISRVEDDDSIAQRVVAAIYPHTGHAHIIGVTGAPGAGKSSLVNELAKRYRSRGQTVGIVAVDPTSPFSGGAILGDRIRMHGHSGDPGIFIRSMASRGCLGGLARATADVVKLVDAAGYDQIIIETVGGRPGGSGNRLYGTHHHRHRSARPGRRYSGHQGRYPRDCRRLRGQQGGS